MDVHLKGKIILVTGSTQGLGAKIAALAVESGASGVMLTGRDAERGLEAATTLSHDGVRAAFTRADLGEPFAPQRVIAATVAEFGRIDLLVNCAGLTDRASLLDATLDRWERLFAVNTRAPFFLMQGAVSNMLERKAVGAIVNVLSMNAHCGSPELAIYSATKGALATLTRNTANACLADQIRVNGINMGWAATPAEREMQANTLGKGRDWEQLAAAKMPLGRLLTDDEVAQLAIFLLSEQSGLLTGALIDLEQRVIGAPTFTARS